LDIIGEGSPEDEERGDRLWVAKDAKGESGGVDEAEKVPFPLDVGTGERARRRVPPVATAGGRKFGGGSIIKGRFSLLFGG